MPARDIHCKGRSYTSCSVSLQRYFTEENSSSRGGSPHGVDLEPLQNLFHSLLLFCNLKSVCVFKDSLRIPLKPLFILLVVKQRSCETPIVFLVIPIIIIIVILSWESMAAHRTPW